MSEENQNDRAARVAAGEFVRPPSTARNAIAPGTAFPPTPNRYHLIIANNCPWCHRVSLVRAVLGLTGSISMDVCFPNRVPDPEDSSDNPKTLWVFDPSKVALSTGKPFPEGECTLETATGKVRHGADEDAEARTLSGPSPQPITGPSNRLL